MEDYRKLIAVLVGMALMWVFTKYAIDLRGQSDQITDAIAQTSTDLIGLATPVAVYIFRNGRKEVGEHPWTILGVVVILGGGIIAAFRFWVA